MTTELKNLMVNIPHSWLNPLRKQSFRLKLSIEDFLSLGLVEFVRNLPDAYMQYMDAKLPDPILKADKEHYEVLTLTINLHWSKMLEQDAKALQVTPLTLIYVSLLWLADLPEDDHHLITARDQKSWLSHSIA
jgi:hypothetical protein